MAWHNGRYYVRKIKQHGRAISEYVGGGELGRAAATLDAQDRGRRLADAAAWRKEKDQLEALDARVATLCELIEMLARAALTAAGYHQHKRGEWRKRRAGKARQGQEVAESK